MVYLKGPDEGERYETLFGDIWESARLRISIVEGENPVPQGEIIFEQNPADGTEEILYEIGDFWIYELSVSDPFTLLTDLAENTLPTPRGNIEVETQFSEHPESFFQDGPEGFVKTSMDYSVLKAGLSVDTSEGYSDHLDQLHDRIKRAEQPYFKISRCEEFYFENVTRVSRSRPEIAVIGETGIDLDISDTGKLSVEFPTGLKGDLSVSFMPQAKDQPGARYDIDRSEVEETSGYLEFNAELEREDVPRSFVYLYLNDELILPREFQNEEYKIQNHRCAILEELDQRGDIYDYLETSESNVFEIAVLNVFVSAGYQVQWFGENGFAIPNHSVEIDKPMQLEVDLIAHHPDNTQTLFIECTVSRPSEKQNNILDRMSEIWGGAIENDIDPVPQENGVVAYREPQACIATSRSEDSLNDTTVEKLNERDIEVLDADRLNEIYELSKESVEPVEIGQQSTEVF